MAEEHDKARPAGLGQEAASLRAALERALENEEAASKVRVVLTVSGGLPEDRVDMKVALTGDGRMRLEQPALGNTADAASGAKAKRSAAREQVTPEEHKVDARGLIKRLAAVDGEALMEAEQHKPIPPDSLVGRLTIEAGERSREIVFMADPEQARTAGHRLPPALEEVVEELYRMGGQKFDPQTAD